MIDQIPEGIFPKGFLLSFPSFRSLYLCSYNFLYYPDNCFLYGN